MPVLYLFEFDDATLSDYDRVIQDLDFRGKPPAGQLCHLAYEEDGRVRVMDVWETEADFERFFNDKLQRAMEKHHLGQPRMRKHPVHNTLGLREPSKRK